MPSVEDVISELLEINVGSLRSALIDRGVIFAVEALRRRPKSQAPVAASHAQRAFWFLHEAAGQSATQYNATSAFRVRGELSLAALNDGLVRMVSRHEALRTTLNLKGEELVQEIQAAAPLIFEVEAWDGESFEAVVAAFAAHPFDLAKGPMIRCKVMRIAESDHLIIVAAHHVVADGWTMNLLEREFADLYARALRGETQSSLPMPALQYADYTVWLERFISSAEGEAQLERRLQRLDGFAAELPLPYALSYDHKTPLGPARSAIMGITPNLAVALRAFVAQQNMTLYAALLAAYAVLLFRSSGVDRFTIASPMHNRLRPGSETIVGNLANVAVSPVDLADNPQLVDAVRAVWCEHVEAGADQDIPFDLIVQRLNPARMAGGQTRLNQAMFVQQNLAPSGFALEGLAIERLIARAPRAKCDLLLEVEDQGEAGLLCRLEYPADRFDEPTIESLCGTYQAILEDLVERPLTKVMSARLTPHKAPAIDFPSNARMSGA